ncbi:MAG: hypothetical protein ABIE43_03190 [Patescibacteria group bacterium]
MLIKKILKSVLPAWVGATIIPYFIGYLLGNEELLMASIKYIGPASGLGALITVIINREKK